MDECQLAVRHHNELERKLVLPLQIRLDVLGAQRDDQDPSL